jgi:hypothetical protein
MIMSCSAAVLGGDVDAERAADHRRDPQDAQFGQRSGHVRGVLGSTVEAHEAEHHSRVVGEDARGLHLAPEAFLRARGDDPGKQSLTWLDSRFHGPS